MQRDGESAGPSSTFGVTVVAVILGRNSLDFTVDVLGDEVTERVGHGPGMRTGVLVEVRARGDGAGDQVAGSASWNGTSVMAVHCSAGTGLFRSFPGISLDLGAPVSYGGDLRRRTTASTSAERQRPRCAIAASSPG
ncbi:hypothetical protein G3I55_06665 [Streptomyces sp. SID6648]|nr:hypothetical protein [Streptomyces sp. SID6648]